MSDSTITKTAFFAASTETVWSFLTEADKLGTWFHPAESDLKADSEYALIQTAKDGSTNKVIWGNVLLWNPTETLQYTFEIAPFDGVTTTVTWYLKQAHGGTMLTLTHEGIDKLGDSSLNLLMALEEGWDEHIAQLRALLKDENYIPPDCSKG